MSFKTPKAPITPAPIPPPQPAQMNDPSVYAATTNTPAGAPTGFGATLITGPMGAPNPNTGKKTLLGQ